MKKLHSIQALRFLAALVVMVGHLTYHSLFPGNFDPALVWLRSITDKFVFVGVDMFFIISGAIMYLVTRNTADQSPLSRTTEFVFRRSARVYPVFWMSAVFGALVFGGVALTEPLALISRLALLSDPPFQPVAWTMVYEIRFYLMVALVLLFAGRKLDLGFGIWAALLTGAVVLGAAGVLPVDPATHLLMLEFIIGVALGALVSRRIFVWPVWMVIAGIIGFTLTTATLFPANMDSWRVYGYGLPMAALLYGTIGLEQRGWLRIPRLVSFAGDISYSLYLWHLPIALCLRPLVPSGGLIQGLGYIGVVSVVSVAVSCASFVMIERPITLWASKFRSAQSRQSGTALG